MRRQRNRGCPGVLQSRFSAPLCRLWVTGRFSFIVRFPLGSFARRREGPHTRCGGSHDGTEDTVICACCCLGAPLFNGLVTCRVEFSFSFRVQYLRHGFPSGPRVDEGDDQAFGARAEVSQGPACRGQEVIFPNSVVLIPPYSPDVLRG